MDANHLPTDSVASVEALAQRLAEWARTHRDASLAELETEVQSSLRDLAPQLVTGLIRATQRSLDPGMQCDQPACPRCDRATPLRRWRTRQVTTLMGVVHFDRPWAHCPGCQHGWSPTDATLGLAPQERLSAGLRAELVAVGGATAFADDARWLERLTGVHVSPETIRTTAEAAGAELDEAQQAARATVERTKAPARPVESAPHQLVAEVDGVMVRFRDRWHEVKLGVIGGWNPDLPREQQRLLAPSYVAAREPAADFAARWGGGGGGAARRAGRSGLRG